MLGKAFNDNPQNKFCRRKFGKIRKTPLSFQCKKEFATVVSPSIIKFNYYHLDSVALWVFTFCFRSQSVLLNFAFPFSNGFRNGTNKIVFLPHERFDSKGIVMWDKILQRL